MMKYALMVMIGLGAVACGDDDNDGAVEGTWCDRDDGAVDDFELGDDTVSVCYPPTDGDSATRVVASGGSVSVPQTSNNTVVVFDASTDGVAIPGNVVIDGNNVTVYGNGTGKTIIDGNVTIAGNNARLRGVTITGSLAVDLNNAAIVNCVVRGDVTISKNNTLFASNDVYGDLTSTSNNDVFVANAIQGHWAIGGHNARCDDNVAFVDDDADFAVDDDETGASLTCG